MRSVVRICLSVLVLLTVLVLVRFFFSFLFFFFFFFFSFLFLDLLSLPTVNLIKENNEVVGVEYEHKGETKREHGSVILATGGFGADFDPEGYLAKYKPETLPLSTTNGDHCTGDGMKMGAKIGAGLVDMEMVQVHPTGLVDPNEPDSKGFFFFFPFFEISFYSYIVIIHFFFFYFFFPPIIMIISLFFFYSSS